MRRLLHAVTALAAVAALAVLGLPAAAADGGLLRLAHLSPDTPAVDVYVDDVADPASRITLPAVDYGAVSDYREVPPGTYAVSMRAAGADPAGPPVLSTTVEVRPGTARTVAGVGMFADLDLVILDDDLALPPAGSARVRVIAAAAGATTVDVGMPGGPPLASGLTFTHAGGYVDVPGGPTTLQITPAGGSPMQVPVTVDAGSVYSLLVLDRPGGGLAVKPVLDAASMPVVPAGGVEAGAGGTAAGAPVGPVALGVAGLAVLLLLATARARAPRRRARP
jgi:hypothetical protein